MALPCKVSLLHLHSSRDSLQTWMLLAATPPRKGDSVNLFLLLMPSTSQD